MKEKSVDGALGGFSARVWVDGMGKKRLELYGEYGEVKPADVPKGELFELADALSDASTWLKEIARK